MAKSIKTAIAMLLALILTFSLTACGDKDKTKVNDKNINSETEKMKFDKDYIKNNMPEEYEISYKILSKEGTGKDESITITMAKTSKGVYFKTDESEQLLLKTDKGYQQYNYDSEQSKFVPSMDYSDPNAIFFQEEMINTLTAAFTCYFGYYSPYKDVIKKYGTEKICGRKCTKYKYDSSTLGYNLKYEFCVDNETGICMRSITEVKAGTDVASANFECTGFKTSGVELPAV